MYTPRTYIVACSSKDSLSFLSLHTVGQLATAPCEISLQLLVSCINDNISKIS